jgi:BA14K-like protein
VNIHVRRLAIALAMAGPLPATAKSSAASIDEISIKAAVPAATTEVHYRAHRDHRYSPDWGYRTSNNYGHSYHSTYSRSWGYPRGDNAVQVRGGGFRGAQAIIGAPGSPSANAYCSQRWPYYDPSTGTYLQDDGEWHHCP